MTIWSKSAKSNRGGHSTIVSLPSSVICRSHAIRGCTESFGEWFRDVGMDGQSAKKCYRRLRLGDEFVDVFKNSWLEGTVGM